MARGISALIVIVSLILSMSILGAVGFYAELAVDVDVEGQNEDVQDAAKGLDSIEFGEGRSSSILEGPLAVVTPVIDGFTVFITVLGNTSGVLQLLFGLPAAVADIIQTFVRLVMLITVLFAIRGAVQ